MGIADMGASGGIAGTKAFQPLYALNTTGASSERRRCQEHRRQWCWDNTMSKKDANGNHSDGVPCPHCPETFDSEHSMQIHRGHVHGPNTVECDVCGEEFERPPSEAKRDGANLCSLECEREHRGYEDPVEFDCEWCGASCVQEGAEFQKYEHNFCSAECRSEWTAEYIQGENNPRWRGGYSKNRGTNWQKLRKRSLEADDYRCQGCGRHDDDHREEHGVGLHVHHIRPVTEFDEPADADTVDNLVPLCRTCHKKWEGVPLRPIFG